MTLNTTTKSLLTSLKFLTHPFPQFISHSLTLSKCVCGSISLKIVARMSRRLLHKVRFTIFRIFMTTFQHFIWAQRPYNTSVLFRSDEGYNFFLFTFFYLYSDLMAIKKREKRDKSDVYKKRNQVNEIRKITSHAVNFNIHHSAYTQCHCSALKIWYLLLCPLLYSYFFVNYFTFYCLTTWRLKSFAIETWRFAYCMPHRGARRKVCNDFWFILCWPPRRTRNTLLWHIYIYLYAYL